MTCDVNGVLASATASVAALQVSLAIAPPGRMGRLRMPYSHAGCLGRAQSRQSTPANATRHAASAERANFDFLKADASTPVSLCGRNAVQLHEYSRPLILSSWRVRLRPLGEVRVNEFALADRVAEVRFHFFPRWARHRQRHDGYGGSSQRLCATDWGLMPVSNGFRANIEADRVPRHGAVSSAG